MKPWQLLSSFLVPKLVCKWIVFRKLRQSDNFPEAGFWLGVFSQRLLFFKLLGHLVTLSSLNFLSPQTTMQREIKALSGHAKITTGKS